MLFPFNCTLEAQRVKRDAIDAARELTGVIASLFYDRHSPGASSEMNEVTIDFALYFSYSLPRTGDSANASRGKTSEALPYRYILKGWPATIVLRSTGHVQSMKVVN